MKDSEEYELAIKTASDKKAQKAVEKGFEMNDEYFEDPLFERHELYKERQRQKYAKRRKRIEKEGLKKTVHFKEFYHTKRALGDLKKIEKEMLDDSRDYDKLTNLISTTMAELRDLAIKMLEKYGKEALSPENFEGSEESRRKKEVKTLEKIKKLKEI